MGLRLRSSGRDADDVASQNPVAEDPDVGSDTDSEDDSLDEKENKEKSKRPPDNDFAQQRLKAFNPVLTAKIVIPLLLGIAVVFAPLGAAMWYASHKIQDFTVNYTHCETMASSSHWLAVPSEYIKSHFRGFDADTMKAQWKLSSDESQMFDDEKKVCQLQFDIPRDVKAPIYMFYGLKNFYANHRRYVNSFSEFQLEGNPSSVDVIKNTAGQNCEPLSVNSEGKRYYPCGLIANSMFNDTFTETLKAVNGTDDDYKMTEKGIAWKTDKERFKKTKYKPSDVVPPPNWYKRFPNGYNETNMPDISKWYQFQNWMHPSALPLFYKLALRNDHDTLKKGVYQLNIGLHFPVLPYKGDKYVYFSQRSVIGGKNDFLGISWMVGGVICFLLGLVLLVINSVKPRKTGDISLLSWNRELDAQSQNYDASDHLPAEKE